MDMTTFIICVSIGTFSFTTVYWIKSFERKFRRDKTRRVDYFITKNKVNVDKFYSGVESDLIHDEATESIWYFTLRDDRLRYRQIPYEDIYRVEYRLDGVVVDAVERSGPSRREMVGGEAPASKLEMQSFIHLKDKVRAVKQIKLRIFLDDMEATSFDVLFDYWYIPKEVKRLKKNDALDWLQVFKNIIQVEERKQA